MMDPKLLLCAFHLDRVQPVRFLFQINLVRYFQCVVTAKRLFVSLWVGDWRRSKIKDVHRDASLIGERIFNYQVKGN